MERNYCQSCRREIPTEGGFLCPQCVAEIHAAERPVMRDPMLRGFAMGLAVGMAAGVLVAALLSEGLRRKAQAAWDSDVRAWERYAQEQYGRGYEAGRRMETMTAEIGR